MPHAHHFLERLDRVTREQTEFALVLYRDHEAVKYVLQHVHLPEDAERVALSLADPKEGPFAIATRDGRFVTCLGAGMKHDLPVVPRPQTEALLAKVAEKRARKELAQRELRPDEEEGDLFHRIFSRGSRFAREDFLAISAFEPMLGLAPYEVMLDIALEVLKLRPAMAHGAYKVAIKGSNVKTFEKLDHLEWSLGHLPLLAGAADRFILDMILERVEKRPLSPMYPCVSNLGSTFFLRAAWFAARLGKAAIPTYRDTIAKHEDWMAVLEGAMGLGAIGLRHANTMNEVKRALHGWEAPPVEPGAVPTMAQSRMGATKAVLDFLEHAEERTEIFLKTGRDFCVTYGSGMPEGHPYRFTELEQVPDDLARTAALGFDGDMSVPQVQTFTICGLLAAARASAEDFMFKREANRAWFGQWSAEESLARLKRFAPKPQEATRAEAKPGRNDPCFCGSGKKYKKCHGGVNPPA
ncbi:MAG TPA: SEC-C metal-binding domain-containing protein [Polyangiaceae bacterium]